MSLLVGVGTCEVVFDSSAQAFLPMLVSSADLPRANGYLFAAEVVTGSILGLSIGAFLFDRAHALPFAVNAASFALAAILIASIKVERTNASPTSTSRELGATHRLGVALAVGRPAAAPAGDHAHRHQLRVDVRPRHLREVRRSSSSA